MMADILGGPTLPRDFSRVVITLENVLYPDDKLDRTPSMTDGLDKDTEFDLRFLGCELIQTAGILLKMPQVEKEQKRWPSFKFPSLFLDTSYEKGSEFTGARVATEFLTCSSRLHLFFSRKM